MKSWMLGGLIGALAGASLYLTLTHRSSPPPAVPVGSAAPQAVTSAAPAPPAPLVLPRVVDVTDIDPLLDPPVVVHYVVPSQGPSDGRIIIEGSDGRGAIITDIPRLRAPGPILTAVGYEDAAPMPAVPAADAKPIPRAVD